MENDDAEVKVEDVKMKIETEDKAEAQTKEPEQDPHSPEAVR